MARTTIEKVRDILPSFTTLTDPQIQAAIDAASCSIDECASGLSDVCAEQAETYLAAHEAACTENTLSITREKSACTGSEKTYGFVFGIGVMGTPYGQTANRLTRGCLHELDKQPSHFFSMGSI